jgi:hypothetical protein
MLLHIFNFGLFFLPASFFHSTVALLFLTYPIFIIRPFIIVIVMMFLLLLVILIEMRDFSELLLILVSLLLALFLVSVLFDLLSEV